MNTPSTHTSEESTTSWWRPATTRGRLGRVLLAAGLVVLGGNLLLIATHLTAWAVSDTDDVEVTGIPRVKVIDEQVWRGRAPEEVGYRSLAAAGVEVIVDLRAEEFIVPPRDLIENELGMRLVRIPIRDGQTPSPSQVQQFFDIVDETDGVIYMHCGAGVGRTGVLAAAYSAVTEDVSHPRLLWRNFTIGPPSLEQIYYASVVEADELPSQPPLVVTSISRLFDGPRRLFHTIRGD